MVRPEITSAIDANVRDLRSSRQRIGGDGKIPLVVCWVSSSAFICEIRGRPCLSRANAAPVRVRWRSVAVGRQRVG